MDYLAIARKYRPQTFEEVVGQEGVATTLRNALESGRVAHAYLFCGPRGVGKTTTARILAKALNCADGPTPTPCNQCESCRGIMGGDDIDVIEIDAASNTGVDDIRSLRDNVRFAPARSRFKVYIVDEVHMLSRSAFNAFLKTLEEPPAHVKFVFCTTEPHRLPDTIHSRCQRFDFRRISTTDIVTRLGQICAKEGRAADAGALALIARSSKGGMRDSETLLDQLTSYCGDAITVAEVEQALGALPRPRIFQLIGHLAAHEVDKALQLVHDALQDGKDIENLLTQVLDHVRSLLVLSVCGSQRALLDETPEDLAELVKQGQSFTTDSLLYISQVLWDTLRKVKEGAHSRVPLELAIIKLARSSDLQPLAAVLERLQALEARLAGQPGSPPGGARPAPRAAAPTAEQPTPPASGEKKKPAAPKKRPRLAKREGEPPASEHVAVDYEAMTAARAKLEKAAKDNPVVTEALRILEGQLIKLEK